MPDLTNKYPYTNFAGVNLDYILNELNILKDSGQFPVGYIKSVEVSDDGVLTFKNGLGETVATVDTIEKAKKDENGHDILGYLFNVAFNKSDYQLTFMRGTGLYNEVKLPKFILVAEAQVLSPDTYTIDNESYDDFTDFLADVDSGFPCRMVLKDTNGDVEYAAPVYKSGEGYFFDLMTVSGNVYTWNSFGLSFSSAGIPPVQTVTLTQVNT